MRFILALQITIPLVTAFSSGGVQKHSSTSADGNLQSTSRRKVIEGAVAAIGISMLSPGKANAKADCVTDCLKNCKLIAPKDPAYCLQNCRDYCEQDDRTDGLSGSVSSSGGEVGILGQGTVPKGEDKPPSINLPGLDFTSEKGRKLLGY
jgi:hypothetical protein